jgi:hypothetical protein
MNEKRIVIFTVISPQGYGIEHTYDLPDDEEESKSSLTI